MDATPPHPFERRYRAIADTLPQMLWAADAAGRHVYYNRRWYDYTGATPEQTMGWGWQAALQLRDATRREILKYCGEPDLA